MYNIYKFNRNTLEKISFNKTSCSAYLFVGMLYLSTV